AWGARLAEVRSIFAHVGNYPPYKKGLQFQKFRLLVQLGRPVTTGLICCSDYIRQGVIHHFQVSPVEAITIHNGCPISSIPESVNSVIHIREGCPFTVGMVARLEQHKDQPTLIRAAHYLQKQGFNIKVQLIGDGSRRQEYETLIDELSLQETVHLLGMRRDIPILLKQMDVFAFSVKPDEGFGIALVEAMMAGVPVIATDVGACREVLHQGRYGVLVEPQNPHHLAEEILSIMNFPHQTEKRVQLAYEHVKATFGIETMAQAYASKLKLVNSDTCI
ncbi:MAG TPA: glycosyltransferase, partial [Fusibacter sp.]|nr:glycosyltransferase [Fusibacter sp.]